MRARVNRLVRTNILVRANILFRAHIFSFIILIISITETLSFDENATREYEKLSRTNVVFRPGDRDIKFWGNETSLPHHVMFDDLIHNGGNATIEDPFVSSAVNRQLDEKGNETVWYEPSWTSLDKRETPSWYDEAKIGVFVHWGVYSVPAYGSSNQYDGYAEWFLYEWRGRKNPDFVNFMEKNYEKGFEYEDFASKWHGEFFNATVWADLVARSGAKYFVMTTKHHDGYTLWQTNSSKVWNSVESGPRRDIIAELAEAFNKEKGVHFGLYYSLYEWFHPLYLQDKRNNFTSQEFIKRVLKPQLYELVSRYKPEYIWADGDWEAGYEYWNSTEFLAWLYNESPVKDAVLVNDRWGVGSGCKHGDIKTCGTDRFNPKKMQEYKWENAMTIDKHSWGFRRNAILDDYMTMENLTDILAETISLGGNLLMNIGPNGDGTIAPIFEERLNEMGEWLKVNGEGIYGSKPWRAQNDTSERRTWYTTKDSMVYAIVLDWPTSRIVSLTQPIATAKTRIHLLGATSNELIWAPLDDNGRSGVKIDVTGYGPANVPCKYAWVFRLSDVS